MKSVRLLVLAFGLVLATSCANHGTKHHTGKGAKCSGSQCKMKMKKKSCCASKTKKSKCGKQCKMKHKNKA
jgi:hypothetical protein